MGLGEAYALGCALAWGIAVVLLKKSGESLAPFALNLLKNLIGMSLIALTLVCLGETAFPQMPADMLLLCLASGLLGIAWGDTLYLRALNLIGAGRMAAAQTLYSPFVILMSVLWLGERLRAPQWLGVAAVLAGILLVTWVRSADRVHGAPLLRGVLLAAFSVFLMALGIVMAKPALETQEFLWVVLLRLIGGTLGLLAVIVWRRNSAALWREYRAVRHWPQVIAAAVVGTYISMMLWLAGYKYTQASIAAVLNEFAAVFILLLAVIFLRERVTARQIAGVMLAVAGVATVVLL